MIGKLLAKVLGQGGTQVVEYFDTKQKLKQALKLTKLQGKIEIEKAKANAKIKSAEHAHEWSLEQIKNSGWKDEYVLVVLSVALIGCFIPGVQSYVLAGFGILEQTPEWYRWLVITVFAAVYGIKPVVNIWKGKKDG